ncbi:globin domain-containing protein [Roseococcus sp. YIM B11640]|uniref:globin domain-containing protein n=1 Tax=Roseococcus sp. YIM B11640 TaxID=3133973 RepID=UPI003C79CDA5
MTPRNCELIRNSFPKLAGVAAPAAALFFRRLFAIDPTARRLFAATDLEAQGARLMATLGFVVGSIDRPDRLRPAIRALAARHASRGVRPDHYLAVGEALLWTLERGLGPDFDADLRVAWTDAYLMLVSMLTEHSAYPMAA